MSKALAPLKSATELLIDCDWIIRKPEIIKSMLLDLFLFKMLSKFPLPRASTPYGVLPILLVCVR